MKFKLVTFLVMLLTWQVAKSSGIRLSNLTVESNRIIIDVAWDFSWNLIGEEPNNHDAVWLFVKGKTVDGVWHTLPLEPFYEHSGENNKLSVSTNALGIGALIKPLEIGVQQVADQLIINLADVFPMDVVEMSVQAIELVWVSESSYYLGDTQSKKHFYDSKAGEPYFVSNEQQIQVDSINGLWNEEGGLTGDIPENFPKGFDGFYAMKYEISQSQYVAFLNTLSFSQQTNHVTNNPENATSKFAFYSGENVLNRNGISVVSFGHSANNTPAIYGVDGNNNEVFDEADDGGNRACNFLNFSDVLAYLDWAGLRPFTELEFEKICRGPKSPVKHEFAWGTPYVVDANTVVNDGFPSEKTLEQGNDTVGLASIGYVGLNGGLRNGFAASVTTNRVRSGASYYGVMELSGNLWEYAVKAFGDGLLFDGTNGDGVLDASGMSNESSWYVNGGCHRGGAWNSGVFGVFRDLAVSDRFYIDLTTENRRNTTGGRGALSW